MNPTQTLISEKVISSSKKMKVMVNLINTLEKITLPLLETSGSEDNINKELLESFSLLKSSIVNHFSEEILEAQFVQDPSTCLGIKKDSIPQTSLEIIEDLLSENETLLKNIFMPQ